MPRENKFGFQARSSNKSSYSISLISCYSWFGMICGVTWSREKVYTRCTCIHTGKPPWLVGRVRCIGENMHTAMCVDTVRNVQHNLKILSYLLLSAQNNEANSSIFQDGSLLRNILKRWNYIQQRIGGAYTTCRWQEHRRVTRKTGLEPHTPRSLIRTVGAGVNTMLLSGTSRDILCN